MSGDFEFGGHDTLEAKQPKGLSLRWAGDAITNPPPEPEVLVDGMMRAGELVGLSAFRGVGKSFAAYNLAILGDRGEGMVGGCLRVARRFSTLIAQGEVDEWESSRRWRMLTGDGKQPELVAETFDRWRVRVVKRRAASSGGGGDDDSRWSESDEWYDAVLDPRLEETIDEHRFDVLVIDPWAVFYAGQENDNDETESALDKLRDLAMRYRLAVLILHHPGKATDAREPEDLWRGASRLADWCSTRVTFLPHYTQHQAERQGMTRQQARRYVDVKFLRRSTPTDDFSMRLSETGWWERWIAPAESVDGRRIHLDVTDVVEACRADGGAWSSNKAAAESLGVAEATARKLLASAVRQDALEAAPGQRGATIYRLPGAHLDLDGDQQ